MNPASGTGPGRAGPNNNTTKNPVKKPGVMLLRWNNFQDHASSAFKTDLNENGEFTDVTLACGGQFIKAHRLLLAASSPYFKRMFKENSQLGLPSVMILHNVKFEDLQNLVSFIYTGEVNLKHSELAGFLDAGSQLEIRGISKLDGNSASSLVKKLTQSMEAQQPSVPMSGVPARRQVESVTKTYARAKAPCTATAVSTAAPRLASTSSATTSTTTTTFCLPDVDIEEVPWDEGGVDKDPVLASYNNGNSYSDDFVESPVGIPGARAVGSEGWVNTSYQNQPRNVGPMVQVQARKRKSDPKGQVGGVGTSTYASALPQDGKRGRVE